MHRWHRPALMLVLALAASTATAAGFGANVRVNPLDILTTRQVAPAIATGSGTTVYAAWYDFRNGHWEVFFARSGDAGQSFDENRSVAATGAPSEDPGSLSLACSGSDVFIAWMGKTAGNWDVFVSVSGDGGNSFAAPVRIESGAGSTASQKHPSIGRSSDGKLHVAWQDDRAGNWDVYMATSLNGGQSFGAGVRANRTESTPSDQIRPVLAVAASGVVHVAWQDDRDGSWDIVAARSEDAGVSFRPSLRIDDTGSAPSDQTDPAIATDSASSVYIAWQDDRLDPGTTDWRIFVAKSSDGGTSFGADRPVPPPDGSPEQIRPAIRAGAANAIEVSFLARSVTDFTLWSESSANGGASFSNSIEVGGAASDTPAASMAADSTGRRHAAWTSVGEVIEARRASGAASYSQPTRVNDNDENPAVFASQINPAIAKGSSGRIHVAWAERVSDQSGDDHYAVGVATSTNGGGSFETVAPIYLSPPGALGAPPAPAIAADSSGAVYIAWDGHLGEEILFAKSTDGGSSFPLKTRVSDALPAAQFPDFAPAIAVDGAGVIYVAWADGRDGTHTGWNVMLAKSIDGGVSFQQNVRVDNSGSNPSDQSFPTLAVDSQGIVHVAWQDDRNEAGNNDTYYAKSSNGGQSFGGNVRVGPAEGPEDFIDELGPSLAVGAVSGAKRIYVAWSDDRAGRFSRHIYVARSTDGGTTFRRSIAVDDLNAAILDQAAPSIAADANGAVYVAWHDDRDNEISLLDIFFAKSIDGGLTFQPEMRVDDSGPSLSSQELPALAIDDFGGTLVAWSDSRNLDNHDIFFASDRPPTTPTPTPQPTQTPTNTRTPTPTPTPLSPGDLSTLGPWAVVDGQVVRVPLVFHTGTQALGGYLLDLTYDSQLLELETVEGGTAPEFSSTPVFEASPGEVHLSGVNSQSLTSPKGLVQFATLVLRGAAPAGGVSSLVIGDQEMLDTAGTPFSGVMPIDGSVRVLPPVATVGLLGLLLAVALLLALRLRRGRREKLVAGSMVLALTGLALSIAWSSVRSGTGDVDADGDVTLTDAHLVQEFLVGSRALDPAQTAAADVDGSGTVELADALAIAQVVGGLTPPFPTFTPTPSPTPSPSATSTLTVPSATSTLVVPSATETSSATPTDTATPTPSATPIPT